jgi:hypothetical protein
MDTTAIETLEAVVPTPTSVTDVVVTATIITAGAVVGYITLRLVEKKIVQIRANKAQESNSN